MQDLHSFIYPKTAIAPVSVSNNTAQVGNIIQLSAILNPDSDSVGAFDGLEYLINIGAFADSDATFTVLLEDSDDGITFAAVADEFLLGTEAEASFTIADLNTCKKLGYVGGKDYTRITVTPANNTGATVFGVIALPCYARSAAVENN